MLMLSNMSIIQTNKSKLILQWLINQQYINTNTICKCSTDCATQTMIKYCFI